MARSRFLFTCLAASAALLGSTAAARSAVIYSYVTDAATYNASSGSTSVRVFLKETLTNGSTSVVATDGGLATAGFRVQLASGGGVQISAASPDTAFGGLPFFTGIPGTNAAINVTKAIGHASPSPDPNGLIPLATLTFTPTGTGGSTALFNLTREDGSGTNTLTESHAYDLDNNSTNPAFTGVNTTATTFSVTVPEPASLSTIAVAGLLLCRRKR